MLFVEIWMVVSVVFAKLVTLEMVLAVAISMNVLLEQPIVQEMQIAWIMMVRTAANVEVVSLEMAMYAMMSTNAS
jgi:hypothetical protein